MLHVLLCLASFHSAAEAPPLVAFIGLHGGEYETLLSHANRMGMRLTYVTDDQIARQTADLSECSLVLIQHVRAELRSRYQHLFRAARKRNPGLKILDVSGFAGKRLESLRRGGSLEHDPRLKSYYGVGKENLRRLLVYLKIKYLGGSGEILPPVRVARRGLYHPDHEGLFKDVPEFLGWVRRERPGKAEQPRVAVAVHYTHLVLQQPAVVRELIKALERQGLLAAGIIDLVPDFEPMALEFKPRAVVHVCHTRSGIAFRKALGVPHLHGLFFRKQSVEEWRTGLEGLASSEMALQIVSQEIRGAVEPQTAAGTVSGGGSSEAFTPIAERIEHLARRAAGWVRLATLPEEEKKVALIYWNREMGKGELMRGSATGMFMNAPRSLLRLLGRLREKHYVVDPMPASEHEMLGWMMDHGRQVGLWATGELDRLARSGKAVLVPESTYLEWFTEKLSDKARGDIIKAWGPPPGRFSVWTREGRRFIVIPRIALGNIVLLPQPLRGEAHDSSKLHDKLVPPPHNYLCTYFWLQQGFKADAFVHFGTHGSEFLLPGRPTALGPDDWPDVLMGDVPNINPWVINNLGESSSVRRRAYAVLVDHLTPPAIRGALSDALLNLHGDIDKWATLGPGALKRRFELQITEAVRKESLDRELGFDCSRRPMRAEEINAVQEYLHAIHEETIPSRLHVLGEAPPVEEMCRWIAVCLGARFEKALQEVLDVPPQERRAPGDVRKYLGSQGEELVRLVVRDGLGDEEALKLLGAAAPTQALLEQLGKARQLARGLASADDELKALVSALAGRFVPPGPGNSPERNPAVLPTGRNMYVMNPEEVPSRPSWELGKKLVDSLLAQQRKSHGRLPRRVAFTLNSFATFQDYGIMESQILYLMGVRPVWDSRNLVTDVELIPGSELRRPRIDVFISALGYYRDTLPTRMRLIDRAVRLVCDLDEEGNALHANSLEAHKTFLSSGMEADRAERLSKARIFGAPPGETGSAGWYYLVERSGDWDSREELIEIYLEHTRHAYTEGLWGTSAPAALRKHIQGSEVVLRSWSDRTRSPLSNKYVWYKGGSLSLAIKRLTGKEPEFFLSDVRDLDRASVVAASAALRRDFRVRLFNRNWIERMMKEGYAGADQIAVHVSNTMGWKIMRPGSVSDETWERIVDVYLRDSKKLGLRSWFEAQNPFAFQEVAEILLETVRKGMWDPSTETLQDVARAYAGSVASVGEGEGLRGGGNEKLTQFVERVLSSAPDTSSRDLLKRYLKKLQVSPRGSKAPARDMAARAAATQVDDADRADPIAPGEKQVEGHEIVPARDGNRPAIPWLAALAGCLLLIGYGIWKRPGLPS